MSRRLLITLNARLRPLDRGDRYEDPLQEVLEAKMPGCVIDGGGTLLIAEREPASCDIDLTVADDAAAALTLVIGTLEAAGAPKGSTARLDDAEPVVFGVTEGLGVYLNGTDLPDEVYRTNDINDLVGAVIAAIGDEGDLQSYWEGPAETALYLYGGSAARMIDLLAGLPERFPLAQRWRLVPL
ncbi:hypothetical protein ACQP2X_38405 [Actinoplanes sp. CA-131856]